MHKYSIYAILIYMTSLPKFNEEWHLAASLKTSRAVFIYEKLLVGSQIKELRKKAHISQKTLAAKLKTSQSVIARLENGKQNCTISTLINLASFFGKKLNIKFQ